MAEKMVVLQKGKEQEWGRWKRPFSLGRILSFQWVIQVEMSGRLVTNSDPKSAGNRASGAACKA
jgi:hypothetical protein